MKMPDTNEKELSTMMEDSFDNLPLAVDFFDFEFALANEVNSPNPSSSSAVSKTGSFIGVPSLPSCLSEVA